MRRIAFLLLAALPGHSTTYVVHEHPVLASFDTTRTMWNLAHLPSPGSVECFLGLAQEQPRDYSINGQQLFSQSWRPEDAPNISCNYWF